MSPISFSALLFVIVLAFVAMCMLFLRRHKTPAPFVGRYVAGRWVSAVVAVLSGLALAGCATPAADYVAADKVNYQDIAPKYSAYVEGDPLLTEEQKQAERDSLEIWRQRVDAGTPSAP